MAVRMFILLNRLGSLDCKKTQKGIYVLGTSYECFAGKPEGTATERKGRGKETQEQTNGERSKIRANTQ